MGLFDSIGDIFSGTNLIGGATGLVKDQLGSSATSSTSIPAASAEEQALRDQLSKLFLTTDDAGNSIPGLYNASDSMQNYMSLTDEWKKFSDKYSQQYEGIADDYSKDVASIPGLSLKLPSSIGGASLDLAPNQWANLYQNKAGTLSNLADSGKTTEAAALGQRGSIAQFPLNLVTNYMNTLQSERTGQPTTTQNKDADLMQIASAIAMFGMA